MRIAIKVPNLAPFPPAVQRKVASTNTVDHFIIERVIGFGDEEPSLDREFFKRRGLVQVRLQIVSGKHGIDSCGQGSLAHGDNPIVELCCIRRQHGIEQFIYRLKE